MGMRDQPISINGTRDQVVNAVSRLNDVVQDLADRGKLTERDFVFRPSDNLDDDIDNIGFDTAGPAPGLTAAPAPARPEPARHVDPAMARPSPSDLSDGMGSRSSPGGPSSFGGAATQASLGASQQPSLGGGAQNQQGQTSFGGGGQQGQTSFGGRRTSRARRASVEAASRDRRAS